MRRPIAAIALAAMAGGLANATPSEGQPVPSAQSRPNAATSPAASTPTVSHQSANPAGKPTATSGVTSPDVSASSTAASQTAAPPSATPSPQPSVTSTDQKPPARIASRASVGDVREFRDRHRDALPGCPPDISAAFADCTLPDNVRQGLQLYDPASFGLSGIAPADYRLASGNLVGIGADNRIERYIPLLGGALAVGAVWPAAYRPVAVPEYYRNFYDLGPTATYRYANDVIYRIDPASGTISAVAAVLTGDQPTVGKPLPAGYGVYNVPLGYRDRYHDEADAIYRYGDGYIYRANAKTKIVTAVIQLLT